MLAVPVILCTDSNTLPTPLLLLASSTPWVSSFLEEQPSFLVLKFSMVFLGGREGAPLASSAVRYVAPEKKSTNSLSLPSYKPRFFFDLLLPWKRRRWMNLRGRGKKISGETYLWGKFARNLFYYESVERLHDVGRRGKGEKK